jgi:lipid II:glycine glycyltransferase (peptidoglycan interpeptide bridge formation enzyme)
MHNLVFHELSSTESFDVLKLNQTAPFTQAAFYGAWQQSLGRKVRRFSITRADAVVGYCQLVQYPLVGGKTYWYAPYGPVLAESSPELLQFIGQELTAIARKNNVVFVRLDPTPVIPKQILAKLFTLASFYTYHSAYFQPRTEWWLPLEATLEQLLRGMHKNTRYSLRMSEQKGVQTEIISTNFEHYFTDFYNLLSETATRNHFTLHPKQYYQTIFKQLSGKQGYLVIARLGGEILAVDLIIRYGEVAHYVFAGSSGEHREVLAAYAALWAAVVEAKARGCRYFNFGGIAVDETYHGWGGLSSFKRKFGGEMVAHSELVDLVLQPMWYYLYNLRKFIRQYI